MTINSSMNFYCHLYGHRWIHVPHYGHTKLDKIDIYQCSVCQKIRRLQKQMEATYEDWGF